MQIQNILSSSGPTPSMPGLTPGQWVIYRKSKRSTSPGPRAASVQANPKGEKYSYVVDKFWVVRRTLADGTIELQTPGGKRHEVALDDPNLRKPSWLERLIWRDRFIKATDAADLTGESGVQAAPPDDTASDREVFPHSS